MPRLSPIFTSASSITDAWDTLFVRPIFLEPPGWASSHDQSELPITPCFVLSFTESALYYCNGTVVERLSSIINDPSLVPSDQTASANYYNANSERAFIIYDSSGARRMYAQAVSLANGKQGSEFIAQRNVNGTDVFNGIGLYIDSSGNRSYFVSDSAAFRSGIGLSDTPISSTTIADVITVNSTNATISNVDYKQWGKVASLRVTWTNKAAISVPASGNISNIEIGTIVSGKRPANNRVNWHSDGDNAGAAWGYIMNGGAMGMGAAEGTGAARTIAAGSTFVCYVSYIVA